MYSLYNAISMWKLTLRLQALKLPLRSFPLLYICISCNTLYYFNIENKD